MKQAVRHGYIARPQVTMLFLLCWIAYFSTYIGRCNYSAAIAEIIRAEGFSGSECGLVGTGFFICYGIGQLFSGLLGDYIHPKWMVFIGITVSACTNMSMAFTSTPAQMLTYWCINGVFQSMTWSPIVRTFAEYFPIEYRNGACIKIATTYPLGVLFTYCISAGLIMVSSWRTIFVATAVFMFVVAFVWFAGFSVAERHLESDDYTDGIPREPLPIAAPLIVSHGLVTMLGLIGVTLAMQGALRDGVMTWIPTYLSSIFGIGTTLSIFSTTALPILNLVGVRAAHLLYDKRHLDETQVSVVLFVISCISAASMMLLGRFSLMFSVFCFAVITSCMTGINVMLVSFIPTHFVKWKKVSFVSGLVNSMVYAGSSIATFGIGAVADWFGWGALIGILFVISLLGTVTCLLAVPRWKAFLKRV